MCVNEPAGWLDLLDQSRADATDPTRFSVEVLTLSGRAAAVEFRFRMDSVEVWHSEHCCGVFDRKELRLWLADPFSAFVVDEVTFTLDRAVDNLGRVAITLPDVRAWTLSPVDLINLKDRV
jgi:hypothetical protein